MQMMNDSNKQDAEEHKAKRVTQPQDFESRENYIFQEKKLLNAIQYEPLDDDGGGCQEAEEAWVPQSSAGISKTSTRGVRTTLSSTTKLAVLLRTLQSR